LLLVEDDPGLVLTLTDRLRASGYTLVVVRCGEDALARLRDDDELELALLDVMLPGIDGFETCRLLRKAGHELPVLMLTARGTVRDRVQGLRGGADDYLVKPFDPAELIARVEALLRRAPRRLSGRITFGQIELDLGARTVTRGGHPLELTALELKLLAYLVRREGEVVTRAELLRSVWGLTHPPRTRTVDVHVTWLRAKLEPERTRPRHIHTVRGEGYRFTR
jgi:DNA-binding response OmpR family regulator